MGAASVSGLAGIPAWFAPLIDVRACSVFPDAPLALTIADGAPAGCSVTAVVVHDGCEHRFAALAVHTSGPLTLTIPYPHDDIIAGRYDVHVELTAANGRRLERCPAGGYTLRAVRFSA